MHAGAVGQGLEKRVCARIDNSRGGGEALVKRNERHAKNWVGNNLIVGIFWKCNLNYLPYDGLYLALDDQPSRRRRFDPAIVSSGGKPSSTL